MTGWPTGMYKIINKIAGILYICVYTLHLVMRVKLGQIPDGSLTCLFMWNVSIGKNHRIVRSHEELEPHDLYIERYNSVKSLQWRHNGHDGVSNHQPHNCLLNRLYGRRSKKTSKLLVTGLCVGNSPGPVNSPHKWPVTRKMFPLDDVIMFTGVSVAILWSGTNIATLDSLWPSEIISSGSTLAQVMALLPCGDNPYLNQYWLIITDVQ